MHLEHPKIGGVETYQVVTEQLHDKGRVLVALLTERVEFYVTSQSSVLQYLSDTKRTGNRVIESLLREVASLIGGVQDLVVENGEVEGETEADGVRGRQLGLRNFGGSLVCIQRLVGRLLSSVTDGELGKVSVIITLPRGDISQMRPS